MADEHWDKKMSRGCQFLVSFPSLDEFSLSLHFIVTIKQKTPDVNSILLIMPFTFNFRWFRGRVY